MSSIIGRTQNNPVAITYHNVTARYNAYFIAKERILEIENAIYDQYDWKYNEILPIHPQYDTTTSKALENQITDCIEKASLAIQRHPESRWEDDAYILVGKARLYGSEFPEAIETFKWVNTNGDDTNDQHRALIYLLRTFTEAREFKNALAVIEYLDKQELSEQNLKFLALNSAYYYQHRENYPAMVDALLIAQTAIEKGNERARIHFIIGQVYQELGMDKNSYSYFKQALKESNNYELSFYSKLHMARVTPTDSKIEARKVRKYFKKLLRDPKNLEYKDQIYYAMGQFEIKLGNLKNAIDQYKLAIVAGKDNDHKARVYLALGQIYDDSLANYKLAHAYYDSTLQVLPKDAENFEIVKNRHEVLTEFVKYFGTIEKNDSLLELANLGEEELNNLLDSVLFEMEEEISKEAEAERKRKRKESISPGVNSYNEENQKTIEQNFTEGWYFYNGSEVSRGISEFRRIWGEITLEDDWRRSIKSVISENDVTLSPKAIGIEGNDQEDPDEKSDFDRSGEREKLLATIPRTQEAVQELLSEIEEAYYQLGNIYNFKLSEFANAILNFESLLKRFPKTAYRPEVLYQLYLLYQAMDSAQSRQLADQLVAEYPESDYAKLIKNPNYIEESKALIAAFKRAYEHAYNLYEGREYKRSIALIDSVTYGQEENEFTDNLMFLKAMNLGQTDGVYKYQYELNNFIKKYPESELLDYASLLVQASEDFQINLYSSSRARYIRNFDDTHYFILVYNPKEEISRLLPDTVEYFIKSDNWNLNTGNLVLDDNHAMVLVNDFKEKREAERFLVGFRAKGIPSKDLKELGLEELIITKENFEILYETKDLESYLIFFEKNYSFP